MFHVFRYYIKAHNEKMAETMQQIQMEAVDSKIPMFCSLDTTSRERTSESEMEDTR